MCVHVCGLEKNLKTELAAIFCTQKKWRTDFQEISPEVVGSSEDEGEQQQEEPPRFVCVCVCSCVRVCVYVCSVRCFVVVRAWGGSSSKSHQGVCVRVCVCVCVCKYVCVCVCVCKCGVRWLVVVRMRGGSTKNQRAE